MCAVLKIISGNRIHEHAAACSCLIGLVLKNGFSRSPMQRCVEFYYSRLDATCRQTAKDLHQFLKPIWYTFTFSANILK